MILMMQAMMGAATVPPASGSAFDPSAFVFRIRLAEGQELYNYPFRNNSTYDCTVDWGDGTVESFTENPSHVYASAGEYDVKIAGQCPAPRCQPSDGEKIIEVKQWGSLIGATDWSLAFAYTPSDFVVITSDVFGAGVEDVSHMFIDSGLHSLDCPPFNLSDVIFPAYWDDELFTMRGGAEGMFSGCVNFDSDLSGWCVPSITSDPEGFAEGSALQPQYYPVWGTCP